MDGESYQVVNVSKTVACELIDRYMHNDGFNKELLDMFTGKSKKKIKTRPLSYIPFYKYLKRNSPIAINKEWAMKLISLFGDVILYESKELSKEKMKYNSAWDKLSKIVIRNSNMKYGLDKGSITIGVLYSVCIILILQIVFPDSLKKKKRFCFSCVMISILTTYFMKKISYKQLVTLERK